MLSKRQVSALKSESRGLLVWAEIGVGLLLMEMGVVPKRNLEQIFVTLCFFAVQSQHL